MKAIIIKSLGQLLKINGLKVGDIEKKCGLSLGYFSRIEDYGEITFKTAFELSKNLKISLDDLYEILCEEN